MAEMMYRVRIARCDSVTEVIYQNITYVWWQQDNLVMEMGERGKDRSYIYYPTRHIDHIHVEEVYPNASS